MIDIEEAQELLNQTDELAKEVFESQEKMRSFLLTLSKMYNTSYSNILLLKNQREDISFVANKERLEKYKYKVKDGEVPLKVIKRIKTEEGAKFKVEKVFDISQTNAEKVKDKTYSKEYIETMLKGMCARRGLTFEPNNPLQNIDNIIMNIRDNCRVGNFSVYSVDQYASQTVAEVDATVFAVAKKLNINTRNYNLKDICKWGIDKDTRTLKDSLKYIQKFTNYFVKDFQTQEKLNNIDNEKNKEEEFE